MFAVSGSNHGISVNRRQLISRMGIGMAALALGSTTKAQAKSVMNPGSCAEVSAVCTPQGVTVVTPLFAIDLPYRLFPNGLCWSYQPGSDEVGQGELSGVMQGPIVTVSDADGDPLFDVLALSEPRIAFTDIHVGASMADGYWQVCVTNSGEPPMGDEATAEIASRIAGYAELVSLDPSKVTPPNEAVLPSGCTGVIGPVDVVEDERGASLCTADFGFLVDPALLPQTWYAEYAMREPDPNRYALYLFEGTWNGPDDAGDREPVFSIAYGTIDSLPSQETLPCAFVEIPQDCLVATTGHGVQVRSHKSGLTYGSAEWEEEANSMATVAEFVTLTHEDWA